MKTKKRYSKEEKLIWTLAFINGLITPRELHEKLCISSGTSKAWKHQMTEEIYVLNGLLQLLISEERAVVSANTLGGVKDIFILRT